MNGDFHPAMGGILLALRNLVRECHAALGLTAECIGPWLSLVERLVRDVKMQKYPKYSVVFLYSQIVIL